MSIYISKLGQVLLESLGLRAYELRVCAVRNGINIATSTHHVPVADRRCVSCPSQAKLPTYVLDVFIRPVLPFSQMDRWVTHPGSEWAAILEIHGWTWTTRLGAPQVHVRGTCLMESSLQSLSSNWKAGRPFNGGQVQMLK